MRLIVQSRSTGRFLVPDLEDGTPTWVASLAQAGGGICTNPEAAHQLLQDLDYDDEPQLVDLDRLGTANDYPVEL